MAAVDVAQHASFEIDETEEQRHEHAQRDLFLQSSTFITAAISAGLGWRPVALDEL